MIGENLSYYKSKLKHAEKSGPQWVTIELKWFLDINGNEIFHNGRTGVVATFSNENIIHDELFWLGTSKHEKFRKVYLKGNKMWIVIRHNITMNGDVEVKREAEIVHYSADEKMPNYPSVFEEYDIAAI